MRLFLVRHGDAHAGFGGVIGGRMGCTGLTDLGRRQAEALRDHLARSGRIKADVLIVSELPRAIETAQIIAPGLGLQIARHECDLCEVHTGPYAHVFAACGGDFRRAELQRELQKVAAAGAHIRAGGMRFNAGHALNYHNVQPVAALDQIEELHIGHAIVSRAIYIGLRQAVRQMKDLMVMMNDER